MFIYFFSWIDPSYVIIEDKGAGLFLSDSSPGNLWVYNTGYVPKNTVCSKFRRTVCFIHFLKYCCICILHILFDLSSLFLLIYNWVIFYETFFLMNLINLDLSCFIFCISFSVMPFSNACCFSLSKCFSNNLTDRLFALKK